MAGIQRYVSDELSHFVGRGMADHDQYDLLAKILQSGWISHKPHDVARPRSANLDLSKPISTDEMIAYQVVCFCDIPEGDLAIHVGKYSKFGLSFKKEFLIGKGACPVFYVANESPVPTDRLFTPPDFADRVKAALARGPGGVDRAIYFDTTVRAVIDIFAALDAITNPEATRYFPGINVDDFKGRLANLMGLSKDQITAMEGALNGNAQARIAIRMFADFLLNYVFSYVKCFDATRDVGDPANYYMEREWRVANNVQFSLGDVARIFLPKKFAEQFRKDFPGYLGQLSFIA